MVSVELWSYENISSYRGRTPLFRVVLVAVRRPFLPSKSSRNVTLEIRPFQLRFLALRPSLQQDFWRRWESRVLQGRPGEDVKVCEALGLSD